MVLKRSKCGLNTGNTIRKRQSWWPRTDYSCVVIGNGTGPFTIRDHSDDNLPELLKQLDIDEYFPNDMRWVHHLELSMGKKQRWKLPDLMKMKVADEIGNPDIQVKQCIHSLIAVLFFESLADWGILCHNIIIIMITMREIEM